MNYRAPIERTFRNTVRNAIGLVFVSIASSFALIPLLSSPFLSTPIAWVAGLWTTCLLIGVVSVGIASFTNTVASRGISLGTEFFWAGIRRQWREGIVIGGLSFVAILLGILMIGNPLGGYFRTSVSLFGVYLLCGWWVWVAFTLPILAQDECTVRTAFTRAGIILLERPLVGLWYFLQALGLTILSIVTIVTPFILLPGLLSLLGSQIVDSVREECHPNDVSP